MTELLLDERQTRIQQLLEQSGRVLASELAESFGVSEDTIRRDLREMAAAGLCKRVYGGALVKTFIKEKNYNKYMSWVNKGQKKFDWIFFGIILLPIAPDDALVLVSSQTKMSWKFFLFTIFLGKPLPIFLYSYLLIHGGSALTHFLT